MTLDILLVGNPAAQSGKNAERIDHARALLSRGGSVRVFATEPEGRTISSLTNELNLRVPDVVVAMGGDGTFREVGAAILTAKCGRKTTLGMLPTGTANDQGRSFGLEAGEHAVEKNVEVILAGFETDLDAGIVRLEANGVLREDYFFDSLGMGLSARVLAQRNVDREWLDKDGGALKALYRDQWVYAGALLRTFVETAFTEDRFDLEAEIDGVLYRYEGLTDLVLKGTRIYGGAWVFDRTAKHNDGLFELVPFCGKAEWASKAMVDLDGSPLDPEVLREVGVEHSPVQRGSNFLLTFRTKEPGPIHTQMDGEEWNLAQNSLQCSVRVEPRAIRLRVPEAAV